MIMTTNAVSMNLKTIPCDFDGTMVKYCENDNYFCLICNNTKLMTGLTPARQHAESTKHKKRLSELPEVTEDVIKATIEEDVANVPKRANKRPLQRQTLSLVRDEPRKAVVLANPVRTAPSRQPNVVAHNPVRTASSRQPITMSPNPIRTAPARQPVTMSPNPVRTAPARQPVIVTHNPIRTAPTRQQNIVPSNPIRTGPARQQNIASPSPVRTGTARQQNISSPSPLRTGTARQQNFASPNPIRTGSARQPHIVSPSPVRTAPSRPANLVSPNPVRTGFARPANVVQPAKAVRRESTVPSKPAIVVPQTVPDELRDLVASGDVSALSTEGYYACNVCHIEISGVRNVTSHMTGQKHLKNKITAETLKLKESGQPPTKRQRFQENPAPVYNQQRNNVQTSNQQRNAAQTGNQQRNSAQTGNQQRNAAQTANQQRNAAQPANHQRNIAQTGNQQRNAAQTANQQRNAAQTSNQQRNAAQTSNQHRNAAQTANQQRNAAQTANQQRNAVHNANQQRNAAQTNQQRNAVQTITLSPTAVQTVTQQRNTVQIANQQRNAAQTAIQQRNAAQLANQQRNAAQLANQQRNAVQLANQQKSAAHLANQQRNAAQLANQQRNARQQVTTKPVATVNARPVLTPKRLSNGPATLPPKISLQKTISLGNKDEKTRIADRANRFSQDAKVMSAPATTSTPKAMRQPINSFQTQIHNGTPPRKIIAKTAIRTPIIVEKKAVRQQIGAPTTNGAPERKIISLRKPSTDNQVISKHANISMEVVELEDVLTLQTDENFSDDELMALDYEDDTPYVPQITNTKKPFTPEPIKKTEISLSLGKNFSDILPQQSDKKNELTGVAAFLDETERESVCGRYCTANPYVMELPNGYKCTVCTLQLEGKNASSTMKLHLEGKRHKKNVNQKGTPETATQQVRSPTKSAAAQPVQNMNKSHANIAQKTSIKASALGPPQEVPKIKGVSNNPVIGRLFAPGTKPQPLNAPHKNLANSRMAIKSKMNNLKQMKMNMVGKIWNMPNNDMNMGGPNMNMGVPNMNMGGPNMNRGGANMNMGGPHMNMGGSNMNMGGSNMNMGGPNMNMGGPNMNMGGPNMNMGGPNRQTGVMGRLDSQQQIVPVQMGGPQLFGGMPGQMEGLLGANPRDYSSMNRQQSAMMAASNQQMKVNQWEGNFNNNIGQPQNIFAGPPSKKQRRTARAPPPQTTVIMNNPTAFGSRAASSHPKFDRFGRDSPNSEGSEGCEFGNVAVSMNLNESPIDGISGHLSNRLGPQMM